MGNIASIIFKRVSRPVKHYNLEGRVEKILERDKPKPAPRHPGTENIVNPELSAKIQSEILESNPELLKRLEEVFVTSKGGAKDTLASSRPLPVEREYQGEFKYGYFEPKIVPYGKATLKSVLEFINHHNETPDEWNSQRISEEYNVDKNRIENILKYVDTFTLVLPPSKSQKPYNYNENHTKILGASSVFQIPAGGKTEKDDKRMENT